MFKLPVHCAISAEMIGNGCSKPDEWKWQDVGRAHDGNTDLMLAAPLAAAVFFECQHCHFANF
jgi:hypothetical protein